jgi:hypothetical protein
LTDFTLATAQPQSPSTATPPGPISRPAAAAQQSPADPLSCYVEVERYDKLTVVIDRLEHALSHTHGQRRRRLAAHLARVRRERDRVRRVVDGACRV